VRLPRLWRQPSARQIGAHVVDSIARCVDSAPQGHRHAPLDEVPRASQNNVDRLPFAPALAAPTKRSHHSAEPSLSIMFSLASHGRPAFLHGNLLSAAVLVQAALHAS